MPACRECKFWNAPGGTTPVAAECRRIAPMKRAAAEPHAGLWPFTRVDDWCGEFQKDHARPPADAKTPQQPDANMILKWDTRSGPYFLTVRHEPSGTRIERRAGSSYDIWVTRGRPVHIGVDGTQLTVERGKEEPK